MGGWASAEPEGPKGLIPDVPDLCLYWRLMQLPVSLTRLRRKDVAGITAAAASVKVRAEPCVPPKPALLETHPFLSPSPQTQGKPQPSPFSCLHHGWWDPPRVPGRALLSQEKQFVWRLSKRSCPLGVELSWRRGEGATPVPKGRVASPGRLRGWRPEI